jgi:acyl dehydratase
VLAARTLVDRSVLSADELRRGVHATHDLTVHRLVQPGDVLTTTATVTAIEQRSPGAYETLRLETVSAEGEPVATTHMGSLFLGVDVEGSVDDPSIDAGAPEPIDVPLGSTTTVERHIPSNLGHTYTECARIWNPIHTDAAVADAAGLPGPILHGTATLATAVSEVVRAHGDDPALVRGLSCRFAAMVEIPSLIRVTVGELLVAEDDPTSHAVGFEVTNAHGEPAIRNGVVLMGVPTS